tara:strand:- start:206 stop:1201 length:996 start_codon:yes stop_codon:yes gene_type:complete
MSYAVPANNYPTGIFKQTTPDESQDLASGPRFNTAFKGAMTRSEIYERMYPDGQTATLRIDGPAGNGGFIALQSSGAIVLVTGERNVEKGPGSGKLCIHSHGQQQKHEQRTDIEYSAGDDEENQALNLIAYGDVVEQAVGSTRHIRAQKIVISASEELFLIGKSQVFIQAGSNGGGTITMNAGNVEKITNNDKEVIFGQRMTYGVSEDTTVQFDPRASINAISPGHVNHKILGDYKVWVGGVEQHIVAGGPATPPLVKDRSNTYSAKAILGNANIDAVAGAANINAGAAVNVTAGGAANITAGAAVGITGTGDVSVTGANVRITGALIYLN